jgi:hypothetical protein
MRCLQKFFADSLSLKEVIVATRDKRVRYYVNAYAAFLSQSSMSGQQMLSSLCLDWISYISSECMLPVISIVITLCKKIVNKVITYSDYSSFTTIIIKSCHNVPSDRVSTPSYPDKLKNGLRIAFLIYRKIVSSAFALLRSVSVSYFMSSFFFLCT